MRIGADEGGFPDAYPIRYEIRALKDGAVLKLADALGRHAEVVLSADDARLLCLGILGALPSNSVEGILGSGE
jgi:hypothetical protein